MPGRDLGATRRGGLGDETREPRENRDLGEITIADLALLRLTEVEVHGSDLGMGLTDWSDVFTATALPVRIPWLAVRTRSQKLVDPEVQGTWLLVGDRGRWLVSVNGDQVSSAPAGHDADRRLRDPGFRP